MRALMQPRGILYEQYRRDFVLRQMLLKGKVTVDRDEDVKVARRKSEELTVRDPTPSMCGYGGHVNSSEMSGQSTVNTLVE